MTYEQHKTIWLQPWCSDCESKSNEGREWCRDEVWGKCGFCGAKPVKYVLDKSEKAPPRS